MNAEELLWLRDEENDHHHTIRRMAEGSSATGEDVR
jgi:hypothetical protein